MPFDFFGQREAQDLVVLKDWRECTPSTLYLSAVELTWPVAVERADVFREIGTRELVVRKLIFLERQRSAVTGRV